MKSFENLQYNCENTSYFLGSGAERLANFPIGRSFEVYCGDSFRGSCTELVRLVYVADQLPVTVATIEVTKSIDGASLGVKLWQRDEETMKYAITVFFREWLQSKVWAYNILIPVAQLNNPLHHQAAAWLQDAGCKLQRGVPSASGWAMSEVVDSYDPLLSEVPEDSYPAILLVISSPHNRA
ncbi:hypothetical protein VPZ60_004328 [Salmonella enterica]|nr:hypothetical protein [Salmonella enterica]